MTIRVLERAGKTIVNRIVLSEMKEELTLLAVLAEHYDKKPGLSNERLAVMLRRCQKRMQAQFNDWSTKLENSKND